MTTSLLPTNENFGYRRWVIDGLADTLNRFGAAKTALRFAYRSVQDLYLLDLLRRNEVLRGVYSGRRCVIIGNGIALLEHNLSELRGELTFACNEIFLHPDFRQLEPSFYAMVEPYYGPMLGKKYRDDVFGLCSDISRAFSTLNTQIFLDASLNGPLRRRGLLRSNRLHFVLPLGAETVRSPDVDLAARTPFTTGAVFAMIASAVYMGFKDIFLLGCGYTYAPMQMHHFYARPKFTIAKGAERQIAEFAKAKGFDVARVDRCDNTLAPILTSGRRDPVLDQRHQIMKECATRAGAQIWNVTPSGYASPVYRSLPKAEFDERLRVSQSA